MKFRNDISVLRAIAVLSVCVFHIDPTLAPGGFVGVDVFFVISGYLMTMIITEGDKEGKFSIVSFYRRRLERIAPALILVVLVVIGFGWFFVSPHEYQSLSKHAISSLGFFSNIIFANEVNYFDQSTKLNWLLHTWSLSIEWQFYVIYPICLVLSTKFLGQKITKLILALLLLISLIVISSYSGESNRYYSFSLRAWEMLLGGIVYYYQSRFKIEDRTALALELIGVTLIIMSCFIIPRELAWPTVYTLVPTLGAAMAILAGNKNSFIGNVKLLHPIGNWSYSIYLWHWPIIVAFVYFGIERNILLLLVFIIFGFISYRYFERVRLSVLISLYIITFGLSSYIFLSEGVKSRIPTKVQLVLENATPSSFRTKCHISDYQNVSKSCIYPESAKRKSWAILGDSHSVEIAYALNKKLETENDSLIHMTFSGCIPSYKMPENFSQCAKWYNEAIEYIISDKSIKNVIIGHRLTAYIYGDHRKTYPSIPNKPIIDDESKFLTRFSELINVLAENKEQVYVLEPVPELPLPVGSLITKNYFRYGYRSDVSGTSLEWYLDRNDMVLNFLNDSQFPSNVHMIRSKDSLCDEYSCLAVKNGVPLYFDNNHLSIYGAELLVKDLFHNY